jgi:hypothetical protein
MDASNEDLGKAVLAALEHSVHSLPHPNNSELRKIGAPLLKAAAVRSWKAFTHGATSVGVRRQPQRFRLIPKANRGSKGGFVEKLSCEVSVPLGSAAQLGAGLREALALAN